MSQGDGLFTKSKDGVLSIYTPYDKKVEFIVYKDKTLVYVKSAMGTPAIYPLSTVKFRGPAKAVLMDLDGTSVHSEKFWMYIIEKTIARLLKQPLFRLMEEDIPFVSGHSVSEHLIYCIDKYGNNEDLTRAREIYYSTVDYEMNEIIQGRGMKNAFCPAPGLKDFLLILKKIK